MFTIFNKGMLDNKLCKLLGISKNNINPNEV